MMDELPLELVEMIVDLLDFADICALRTCNSALCAKASQGRFRTFLHPNKRLLLTEGGLRSLVAASRNEQGVGRNLRRLTLVGVCEAATAGPGNEGLSEQIDLLRTAFDSIRNNTSLGKLELLSLDAEVHADGKSFAPTEAIGGQPSMVAGRHTAPGYPKVKYGSIDIGAVWDTTRRTFRIALVALTSSPLMVDELRIFADVQHCSLACDELLLNNVADWPTFRETRRLALSVSHSLRPSEQPDETSSHPAPGREGIESNKAKPQKKADGARKVTGENNARNIVRFLSAFPNLVQLEMQWFSMSTYRLDARHRAEQDFLCQVNWSLRWPQLTRLILVGLRTTTEPLLAFFKKHQQLNHIEMEGIYFSSNPSKKRHLSPLLAHFSREDSKLEYLRLEEIWTSRRVVFGEPEPVEQEWRGEKARQRIRARIYFLPPPAACIENFWALWDRHRRYGPP